MHLFIRDNRGTGLRRFVRAGFIIGCVLACLGSGTALAGEINDLNLVPVPKKVVHHEGICSLGSGSLIIAEDPALRPLVEILSHNIRLQTGIMLTSGTGRRGEPGIVLRLDPMLGSEAYVITVKDSVTITGHDYRAAAWGVATLLQLVESNGGKLSVPCLKIEDAPDYAFRSVMIDLARRAHPVDTLKDTINLLWLYKVNTMHLHLSDNQSTVFTSKSLPEMATPGVAYSIDQWKDIVRFADDRGVTLIPEIDVPGHSGSWVRKMPELFGTTDPKTGESRALGIVNMANERAYEALDLLVGDLAEVFASSPYIHIGTDEVGAGGLMRLPEYRPYCEKHGLSQALGGQAHELFLHFIERMNRIVRKHGKQAIAWNDFGGASTANVKIPTDLVTTVWTESPATMAERGYPIINCCWLPLYLVPPQQRAPEDHRIYDWHVRRFMRWSDKAPTILPNETPIMGAQMCFWEQRYNEVLPLLRPRIPAFAERIWHEKAGRTFEDFKQRRSHTDEVAKKSIFPVAFEVQGLIDEKDVCFEKNLKVKMSSSFPGTIRYTVKKEWEQFPDAESTVYGGPIALDDTMTVSARLYNADGQAIGGVTQQRFRRIVKAYKYRLLGSDNVDWNEMPDFETLKVMREGVTGLMDRDRAHQINRARFAQIRPVGHVDVCVHDVYNRRITELTSQIRFPNDGEYTFKMYVGHAIGELHIGGKRVLAVRGKGREFQAVGKVKAGMYPVVIKHLYNGADNDLNIMVKKPGATDFVPYEELVLPISDWVRESKLCKVPAETRFDDPVKLANRNLATDKKVTVSGGTQAPNVPTNAVDGIPDNSSGWHADPYPQWLQVDLGKAYSVGRVKLYPYYDGRRYYQYTIEVSLDGKGWKQIVDMTKNVEPSTKEGDEHNLPPIQARYVRVNMLNHSANPGVHINELMVYEAEE